MTTKAEQESAARTVRCPNCGAQAHMSCRRYKGIRPVSLKHPHAERIEAASSSLLARTRTPGEPQ